jgi:hypothetical protein
MTKGEVGLPCRSNNGHLHKPTGLSSTPSLLPSKISDASLIGPPSATSPHGLQSRPAPVQRYPSEAKWEKISLCCQRTNLHGKGRREKGNGGQTVGLISCGTARAMSFNSLPNCTLSPMLVLGQFSITAIPPITLTKIQ